MKYILEPSLEHITLIKIVVTLWNQNDIRALLTELSQNQFLNQLSTKWKNIENRVTEKVSHLSLPRILKVKIMNTIKPIGLQILKWMKYYCTDNYLYVGLPYEFCWSPQGTIDRQKTAKLLIKDNLNICERFKLACISCLKDDILELWKKIPDDLKIGFSFPGDPFNTQKNLVRHWANIMQGSDNAVLSYKDAFKNFAENGEKEAVEYFLQNITPSERKEFLVTTAKAVENTNVLCFLFSQMDEEQQTEVFKSKPYEVLRCFLSWPLQSFFNEVANRMWDYLPKEEFENLLRVILVKVRGGYKDYNYKNLYRNFWLESPDTFKSYMAGKTWFLTYLLSFEDKEYLKLFLDSLSHTEKTKLIHCNQGQNMCVYCVSEGK